MHEEAHMGLIGRLWVNQRMLPPPISKTILRLWTDGSWNFQLSYGVWKKLSGICFTCSLKFCIIMDALSTRMEANMLCDLPHLNQYQHWDIATMERTSRCTRFGKISLFFTVLFFILQKRDYMLHYHKDTTSSLQPQPPPNQQCLNLIFIQHTQVQTKISIWSTF